MLPAKELVSLIGRLCLNHSRYPEAAAGSNNMNFERTSLAHKETENSTRRPGFKLPRGGMVVSIMDKSLWERHPSSSQQDPKTGDAQDCFPFQPTDTRALAKRASSSTGFSIFWRLSCFRSTSLHMCGLASSSAPVDPASITLQPPAGTDELRKHLEEILSQQLESDSA